MNTLDGLTIVSLEQAVAAPFATRQLADLGARVIKIERPGYGDMARSYDETVNGMSSHFVWLNRSKESVELDLKSDLGQRAIRTLVAKADVFVQNIGPGGADRLGLGAEDMRRINPNLIYVSISGYGSGGPYANKKAYDLLIQCDVGLVSITGTEGQPCKVGVSVANIAAGMYAYTSVLTALIKRSRTGEGSTIDVSMLECLAEWMGFPMNYLSKGGEHIQRTGARYATISPYGLFRCGDGEHVFLGVQNEREWQTFCEHVLDNSKLATDPRFRSNFERVKHVDDLAFEIERVFEDLSVAEVIARLEESEIPNVVLRDVSGLGEHPQLAARGRWAEYDSPVGPLRGLLPPDTLVGATPVMGAVPALGQHTEAVLAEFGLPPAAKPVL